MVVERGHEQAPEGFKYQRFGGFQGLESLVVPIVDWIRSDPHEAFVDSDASSIVTTALIDARDVYHPIRIFARR